MTISTYSCFLESVDEKKYERRVRKRLDRTCRMMVEKILFPQNGTLTKVKSPRLLCHTKHEGRE